MEFLVGITTTSASYQAALACAAIAKTELARCRVVLGGPHASADSKTILERHPELVDYIVVGEGERALEHLVIEYPDPKSAPGVAYLEPEGRYRLNQAPIPLRQDELDKIDVLYRGGFAGTPGKFKTTTYVSARGCPLKCAFCSVANQPIRARSVQKVKEDVRKLVLAGHQRIAIEDNFFAHTPARTKELCKAFKELRDDEGLDFGWDCQTRVESLARQGTIQQLVEGGCVAVYVGVESLVPDKLRYLNKTRVPENYVATLSNQVIAPLLESPLSCNINLQFGIPNETKNDFDETLEDIQRWSEWASAANKTITIYPQLHVVYPGTAHFAQGVKDGRFAPDIFESFTTWEKDQQLMLSWLGEHFAHGAGGIPEGILNSALLREGRFEIIQSEVSRIDAWLNQFHALEGIEVFRYGAHLI